MCIKCGKVLSALNSGRRHIRETHQFNQRVQCQICKKDYKNKRQLNEHYNTAHGVSARQMNNVIKVPSITNDSSNPMFQPDYLE